MSFPEEKFLIRKAKQGDENSFETLILSCKGKAYNVALRYVKNEQDALDVLQDSFIKIYKSLDKFNEESRFDTWVYRIVVNTCNDFLRKNKNNQNLISIHSDDEEDDRGIEIKDKEATPEESLLSKEENSYIFQCLEKIPIDHKEMIILRDVQQLSYEEIAKILDCSLGTVKSRISRARNNFKEVYLRGRDNHT